MGDSTKVGPEASCSHERHRTAIWSRDMNGREREASSSSRTRRPPRRTMRIGPHERASEARLAGALVRQIGLAATAAFSFLSRDRPMQRVVNGSRVGPLGPVGAMRRLTRCRAWQISGSLSLLCFSFLLPLCRTCKKEYMGDTKGRLYAPRCMYIGPRNARVIALLA